MNPTVRRRFLGDLLTFGAFALMTVIMTWPWAMRIREATPDPGDPYLNAWILWWDYFQTFHDPLNLFHANTFYPYAYSLAFSEHNYGLALPLFPLFALGVTPLAVHGVAILLGFTLSGFGAFRLTRTLTGSQGAAWIAGIGFAFTIFRWHHLSHVNYLSAGWIPLLLEALVLFLQERSRRRAVWLGVAFTMNALSCIHWFVLTLIPLALTALVLVLRAGIEKDRDLWRRGTIALGISGLVLLPFFLPYQQAAKRYGFTRSAEEALGYSATPRQWLNADPTNKLWRGLGENPSPGELCLFPGLFLLLVPLVAFAYRDPSPAPERAAVSAGVTPVTAPRRRLFFVLDLVAVATGTLAFLISLAPVRVYLGSHLVFKASENTRALIVFGAAVLLRALLAWPRVLRFHDPHLLATLRNGRRPIPVVIGLVWAVVGFLGSLGLNTPFHRICFELVSIFRSIRVPARYAMVANLGLAVLAGIGVLVIARRLSGGASGPRGRAVFVAAGLLLLFELRPYPLDPYHGEPDPDELTRYLTSVSMKGGLVQLPSSGKDHGNYLYVLRAADHRKPLVNAVSGFATPIVSKLDELTHQSPVPAELLDFLEGIPTSYLSVNESWLSPAERTALHPVLDAGVASGRLRFVGRFDGRRRNDLYAVTKLEPDVKGQPLPWLLDPTAPPESAARLKEDAALDGNLDQPAEQAVVTGDLRVSGWGRIAGEDLAITLLIDGEPWAPAPTRVPRPDVQSAVPRLGDCSRAGFEVTFPFREEEAGQHELRAILLDKSGRVRHLQPRTFTWKR